MNNKISLNNVMSENFALELVNRIRKNEGSKPLIYNSEDSDAKFIKNEYLEAISIEVIQQSFSYVLEKEYNYTIYDENLINATVSKIVFEIIQGKGF